MIRTCLILSTAVLLLGAVGCSSTNRIVGHNLTQVGQWYGELGVTGDNNNVVVQTGSRLTKLSIIGVGNIIDVDDQCSLGKVEIWGDRNCVTIPANLVVRIAQVGPGNQIKRRPPAKIVTAQEPSEPPYEELQTPENEPPEAPAAEDAE